MFSMVSQTNQILLKEGGGGGLSSLHTPLDPPLNGKLSHDTVPTVDPVSAGTGKTRLPRIQLFSFKVKFLLT